MEGHLYSPLPERHIRLLTLKPLQDPPSGTLDVVSLDEIPKFNALSYAWGAPGDILDLVCSGKILSVRENLGDFLKLASERHHQRPIWIDAICINQEDDAEKNHQIPLMAEIYNSATQVLVWLGSNSEEGDKAFALIPLVADTLENATPDIEGETFFNYLANVGLPQQDFSLWQGIGDILARPWFSRLWVMQEVYSSSSISVLCGSEIIRWEKLTSLIDGLIKHRIPSLVVARLSNLQLIVDGGWSIRCLGDLKSKRSLRTDQAESNKITAVLGSIRRRTATKAVDKIYGSLGMMPLDIQRAITVDVSMTPAQVFVAFAKCFFERGDASLILCHTSSSPRSEGLPSWCPNFAERQLTEVFGVHYVGCTAGHEPRPSGRERIRLRQDYDTIEVTGLEIDRISDVVTLDYKGHAIDYEVIAANMKWDEACLNVARPAFDPSEHNRMLECLCKARIAGGRLMLHYYPRQHDSKWVQDYKEWKSAMEQQLGGGCSVASKAVERFDTSLCSVSTGRRFFISTGRYMGLGPPTTQAGDLICVLYGRPTPFILRPDPDENTYQLIGEAYVNDLMDGEALELRDKYSLRDQTFVIK
jgi:Heterokaryon incompatibility protein (HET)